MILRILKVIHQRKHLCSIDLRVMFLLVVCLPRHSSERPHFRVGARWKEGNVTRALALLFRGWAESETIIFVLHVSFKPTSQWCSSRGVQDLGVRNTTRLSRGSSGGGERSGVLILCLCVFNCICVGIPMAFVGQITHKCICICLIYVFIG